MIGFKGLYFIFLFVFWIIVAGLSWQGLLAGLVAAGVVFWLNRDLISSLFEDSFQLRKLFMLCLFGLSLIWQIVLANIQIAKVVLSPSLPIQPGIVTFDPGLKSDFSKAILANSITLTPGTLTIDVEGSTFTVHALTLAAAQDVVEWPLIAWLRRLEEE